jgi:DNA-binding beta-propeller fold protein YncE
MKFLIRSLAFAGVLSATAVVFGQGRLIGITGTGVWEISMTDASRVQIATLTGSPGTIGELTYDWANDVMYMSSSSNQNLMTVNPDTGAWTVIGQYGLGSNPVMHGLEYHSGTGKLYAMSGGSSHGYHLYDINKTTGAATLIGTSPLTSFHNLGYDSINNIMYMTNSNTDSLYTLNLATGQPTLVGPLGTSTNPNGLAFNHHTGTMYLVDNSTNNLYTVNLQTGAATVVGNLGTSNFLSLAYYRPVPEPATLAALGLGAAILARRRRPKK